MQHYSKEEKNEVARELIDGIEEEYDLNDIVSGIEFIMESQNKTLDEIEMMCWEDSNNVLGLIYG